MILRYAVAGGLLAAVWFVVRERSRKKRVEKIRRQVAGA